MNATVLLVLRVLLLFLLLPCLVMVSLALPTSMQKHSGDGSMALLVPFLGVLGTTFLVPFLVVLRGHASFASASALAAVLWVAAVAIFLRADVHARDNGVLDEIAIFLFISAIGSAFAGLLWLIVRPHSL